MGEIKIDTALSPLVWKPINGNLGLNFDQGFSFFCSKSFPPIIFSILFRASNYKIVEKTNLTKFAFQAFVSEFKFHTNPVLNKGGSF